MSDIQHEGLHNPRLWRGLAVLGTALTIIVDLARSIGQGHLTGTQILAAVLPAMACCFFLATLFRRSVEVLVADLDLLVPIGVALLATQLTWGMSSIPPFAWILNPSWHVSLADMIIYVSVSSILTIVIWVGYAAWQTDLLWRRLGSEPHAPLAPHDSLRLFWRSFGVLLLGWGGIFAALVMALAVTRSSLALTLTTMLVWAVAWNFLTVALLPCGLDRKSSLRSGIARGFRLSLRLARRWWLHLAIQLLLLGSIVAMRVTQDTPSLHSINSSVNVNAIWTGGYAHECKWYSTYADAADLPELPILSTLLTILFLLLAVSLKVKVINELHEWQREDETDRLPTDDRPVSVF